MEERIHGAYPQKFGIKAFLLLLLLEYKYITLNPHHSFGVLV